MSKCEIDKWGNKRWLNDYNQLHRINNPAVEFLNGNKFWYQNGKIHRLDGPALEYADGDKFWYQYDNLHRLDGPACDCINYKEWYIYDKLHRLDGPAVEYTSGEKYWHYHGKYINCNSQDEFLKIIKLINFW